MVNLVRHIPRDEGLAEILRQQSRSTRDVQRATGTEKARTRDSTIIGLLDEFAVTSSPTVEPVGGWSPVAPPWVAGEYVWKRTTTTYGDGATAVGPALLATGNDGAPGSDGAPGADGADGAPGRSVTLVDVMYYLSTSATALAGGSWLTDPPAWVDGRYMWTKTVTTYSTGTPTETDPVNITGAKGSTGTPGSDGSDGADGVGVSSTVVTYQGHTAGVMPAPTGTWAANPPVVAAGNYLWTRTVITYTDSATSTAYSVARMGADGSSGAPGSPGAPGDDGRSVTSIVEQYYLSTSSTAQSGGSWDTSVPAWVDGRFYWTRSVITYDKGSPLIDTTSPVMVSGGQGATGDPGSDGANGADGRGIASTATTYQAGVSGTTAPTGTWSGTVPAVPAGQFLWTRTIFTYTSGTPATTTEYSVGRMGDDGSDGADGRGVTGAVTTYQASASGTAVPGGAWLTSPPTVSPGQFLWSRTVTSYTTGADTNAYSVAQQGATGAPGTAGVSVSSSTMFYWLGATQPDAPTVLTPPAPWSATEPTYTPGTSSNLYVVVRTVLSSGTFSYSVVSMSASFAAAKSAFGKYTFSASAPVVGDGAGKPVGAMWVRKNGVGEIDGYWEWSGSAWQARPLSQEIIPLIVAGMISAGALDAMTITGPLIRTAASGQRLQFDINGLRAFNAVGAQTAVLFSESGALSLNGTLNVSEAGGNSSVSLRGPDGAIQCTRIISGLAASFVSGPTSSRVEAAAGYGGFSNGRAASIEVLQSRARLLLTTSTALGDKASSVAQNIDGDLEISSSGDIALDAGPGGKISLNAAKVEFQGDTDWVVVMTAVGSAPRAKYRRRDGMVQIRGVGGKGVTYSCFTLPVGFRPGGELRFAHSTLGGALVDIVIPASGAVQISNNTATSVYFDYDFEPA